VAAHRVQVVEATVAHAEQLAPRMRSADTLEVQSSAGMTPLAALLASLRASVYSRALLIDGEPAALWGVAPAAGDDQDIGVVWLLTGDLADRHPLALMVHCRAELQRMLEVRPVLTNAVDERYPGAVRWLRWLGFEVGEAVPFGTSGLPFHPIAIAAAPVAARATTGDHHV
jgi:hypothetical protein